MGRTKKALDGRDSHILTLRILLGLLSVALILTDGGMHPSTSKWISRPIFVLALPVESTNGIHSIFMRLATTSGNR